MIQGPDVRSACGGGDNDNDLYNNIILSMPCVLIRYMYSIQQTKTTMTMAGEYGSDAIIMDANGINLIHTLSMVECDGWCGTHSVWRA